jgi:thiol:disulfide interchange protein DsbD
MSHTKAFSSSDTPAWRGWVKVLLYLAGLGAIFFWWTARHADAVDRVGWVDLNQPSELATGAAPDSGGDQLTLIRFSADWCPPCRAMEREVFADAEIGEKVRALALPRSVDLTQPDAGQTALAERFGVQTIPTLILIDGEGRVVSRLDHGVDAPAFLAWFDTATARGVSLQP